MGIDYGEKEREFLDSLAADTGRDLETWMTAIRQAGLAERNEIIDWLRHQGFMFSKASWLERIFNNGGKPIYAERGAIKGQSTRAPARPRAPEPQVPSTPTLPTPPPPLPPQLSAPATPPVRMDRRPEPPPSQVPQPEPTPAAPRPKEQDLDAILAKAKAFRPLASFVLSEIRKAMPEVTVEPHANHLAILLDGAEVALIAISPKDIRLLLQGLGMPFDAGFGPAKMPQGLGTVSLAPTHMAVLTDARAVTPALIERVRSAALNARGQS